MLCLSVKTRPASLKIEYAGVRLQNAPDFAEVRDAAHVTDSEELGWFA